MCLEETKTLGSFSFSFRLPFPFPWHLRHLCNANPGAKCSTGRASSSVAAARFFLPVGRCGWRDSAAIKTASRDTRVIISLDSIPLADVCVLSSNILAVCKSWGFARDHSSEHVPSVPSFPEGLQRSWSLSFPVRSCGLQNIRIKLVELPLRLSIIRFGVLLHHPPRPSFVTVPCGEFHNCPAAGSPSSCDPSEANPRYLSTPPYGGEFSIIVKRKARQPEALFCTEAIGWAITSPLNPGDRQDKTRVCPRPATAG